MSQTFVCNVACAPMREDPTESADRTTELTLGEPFYLKRRRGAWALGTAAHYQDGGPGWVKLSQLERVDMTVEQWSVAGGQWLAQEATDSGSSPLEVARTYLGAPYLWGGMTNAGIDCAGLVHMAYRRTGRLIPRDGTPQEKFGKAIPWEKLRPGHLITYGEPGESMADHIAFYTGDGRILHATGRALNNGVIEETEPEYLRAMRRKAVKIG